jgi:hypothetical protein
MSGDLDDILLQVDCPRCGKPISAPFGLLRHTHSVACICGARISVDLAYSDIVKVDRLIDEANPVTACNDDGETA